ncbi:MAG TPA: phosphopantothenoylcysteine decarboxylase, partial [Elusimicrobiota bacterium]|nr:phosphopantothenoylcysteine decarboxylase [Elusimicrobiota bacterium]
WALARAARRRGARVTLVHGPTGRPAPRGVRAVPVTSAREMLAATLRAARGADAVVGAAAVADWRPAVLQKSKIKKSGRPPTIRLVANPDILKTLSKNRRGVRPRLAGFALETDRLLDNARKKMTEKKLDLIVANGPEALGADRTDAWILSATGWALRHRGTKDALAGRLLDALGNRP